MDFISKKDYFKYALKQDLPLKLDWVITFLGIPIDDTKYHRLFNNEFIVKMDDIEYKIENYINDKPVFTLTDEVIIDKDTMVNLEDNDIKTTYGRVLLNFVLLVYNFKDKIPFQNKVFTVGDIESKYIVKLLKDKDELKEDSISVKEYLSFIDSATYLENWADIISVSSTEKSILPPDGIKEYRKKLIKEAVEEHGENALKDYVIISQIEDKLKAYDKDYLKDDPSLGKLLTGKILNNSRKKLYLMNGAEKGMGSDSDEALLLDKSLDEGWDSDPEKLASQFNSIRFSSYSRGKETALGGLTAKVLLRATSAITISEKDCKTEGYKSFYVTNENVKTLTGRYLIVSGKPLLIENEQSANTYIDKMVKLRSPMYCLSKDESICPICAGTGLAMNANSVSLLVTGIGDVILQSSLKKMHDASLSTMDIDMNDIIT